LNYSDPATYFDPETMWTPRNEFKNLFGEVVSSFEPAFYINPDMSSYLDLERAKHGVGLLPYIEYDQRFIANFKTKLDLHKFPFDQQSVHMVIESEITDRLGMIFKPATADFDTSMLTDGFEVTEWDIMEVSHDEYGSFYALFNQTYSSFSIDLRLNRQPDYYLNRMVSGCVMLVYMCVAIFMLVPDCPDRMMGTITVFLALVAFVFTNGENLPKVSYLTRIDSFMFWSFILVFIMMFLHAVVYFFREAEPDEKSSSAYGKLPTFRKIDVGAGVVLAIAYGLGTGLFLRV